MKWRKGKAGSVACQAKSDALGVEHWYECIGHGAGDSWDSAYATWRVKIPREKDEDRSAFMAWAMNVEDFCVRMYRNDDDKALMSCWTPEVDAWEERP